MTSTILNLTNHPVVVYDGDVIVAEWPPSGTPARIEEVVYSQSPWAASGGHVPIVSVAYASVIQGLPEESGGTVYIVSRVLAAACPRKDVYFPWGEVRDADGRIVGCRALGQFMTRGHGDA